MAIRIKQIWIWERGGGAVGFSQFSRKSAVLSLQTQESQQQNLYCAVLSLSLCSSLSRPVSSHRHLQTGSRMLNRDRPASSFSEMGTEIEFRPNSPYYVGFSATRGHKWDVSGDFFQTARQKTFVSCQNAAHSPASPLCVCYMSSVITAGVHFSSVDSKHKPCSFADFTLCLWCSQWRSSHAAWHQTLSAYQTNRTRNVLY